LPEYSFGVKRSVSTVNLTHTTKMKPQSSMFVDSAFLFFRVY